MPARWIKLLPEAYTEIKLKMKIIKTFSLCNSAKLAIKLSRRYCLYQSQGETNAYNVKGFPNAEKLHVYVDDENNFWKAKQSIETK